MGDMLGSSVNNILKGIDDFLTIVTNDKTKAKTTQILLDLFVFLFLFSFSGQMLRWRPVSLRSRAFHPLPPR